MKVVKGTPKHLFRTGELLDFTYLMLNLEFSCNYQCLKCFNQGTNTPQYSKNNILTFNDQISLIQQAKEMGGKVVVIAGEGEPSIHKDIRTLITEIKSRDMIPIIYSNGRLLTKDITEFYKKSNAVIIISLDSLEPQKYDLLTGTKNQLEQVLTNINWIREIYKDAIIKKDDLTIISFAINTTVSRINQNEIANIKELCKDDIYFICNPLAKLGSAAQTWETLMKNETDSDKYTHLAEQMSEAGGPLTLGTNGLCNYSSNGIAVSPYGHYMTCAYTSLTNDLLGTVKNKSLKEAYLYKHKMEKTNYATNGPAKCLVRANSFQKYLSLLKEQPIK